MKRPEERKKLAGADFEVLFEFLDAPEVDYPGLRAVLVERFAESPILLRICSAFTHALESIEAGEAPSLDMQLMIAKQVVNLMIGVGRIGAAKIFLDASIELWTSKRFLEADTMLNLSGENVDRLDIVDRPWLDYQVYDRKAKTSMLLFCGLAHRFGVELNSVALWLRSLPVNVVYIRDFNNQLYLGGIQALGNLDQTIEKLKSDLAAIGTERIITMGNSGGVYGALHYADLLNAAGVLCFAGPTSLDAGIEEASERPIYESIQTLIEDGTLRPPDLRDRLQKNGIPVRYFYGADYAFDLAHAQTIAGIPTVSIEPLPDWSRHVVIGEMARRNQLKNVLADAADISLPGLIRAGKPGT